jgi:hypothetical protein
MIWGLGFGRSGVWRSVGLERLSLTSSLASRSVCLSDEGPLVYK